MSFVRNYWGLIAVIIFSLPLFQPFFAPGFFPMHDDTQVARIFEMTNALRDGQFPVRWVENLGYGYGYPVFNFYAPLAYYFGSIVHLLGADALLATKITFIFALVASGVFMYLFVRDVLDETSATVAAIIYLYFPYHAVNTYVRGALSELWAYAFIPLVFWGVWRLYKEAENSKLSFLRRQESNTGSRIESGMTDWFDYRIIQILTNKWVLLTTLSFSIIILSHNLTAFVVPLFVELMVLVLFFFTRNKILLLLMIGISIFYAVLLTTFYILPVAFEAQYTNVSSQVGKSANFRDHFVCLSQLWDSPWGFGGSTSTCTDGLSFKLGKTNVLFVFATFIIASLVLFKKKRDTFLLFTVTTIFLMVSILMMLPISQLFWEIFPGMKYVQYPWRFLNFAAFSMSLIIGFGIFWMNKFYTKKLAMIVAVIVIGLTYFYNAKLFVPQTILEDDVTFYTDLRNIQFDVSRRSDEYLPQNFSKPKSLEYVPTETIVMKDGVGSIDLLEKNSRIIRAKATLTSDGVVHYNSAYNPTWNVYVNDIKTDVKQTRNGFDLLLPKGSYELTARLEPTAPQILGNSLSLVGVLGLIIGIIGAKRNKIYGKKTS